MDILKHVFTAILAGAVAATAQTAVQPKATPAQPVSAKSAAAAEDISGMYTFVKEGECLQINLDQEGVSGFISRMGESDTDRGSFLDHFFTVATVKGHDVSFTTRAVHGIWYEFKGKFERGAKAKSKSEDSFYVLRGTLTEFSADADKKTTSRSREVEFKLMAQPPDDEPVAKPKK